MKIIPSSGGEPEFFENYFPLREVWSDSARAAALESRRRNAARRRQQELSRRSPAASILQKAMSDADNKAFERKSKLEAEKHERAFKADRARRDAQKQAAKNALTDDPLQKSLFPDKRLSSTNPETRNNVTRTSTENFDVSRQDVFRSKEQAKQFAKDMVSEISSGETFSVQITSLGRSARIKFSGSKGTTITRSFYKNENGELEVHHDYFMLGTDRGGGTGKQLLSASFKRYQKLGVKVVTTFANIDVGSYAWARYGFKPDNPTLFSQRMLSAANNHRLTPEVSKILSGGPLSEAAWRLSDSPYGKRIMLGNGWDGHIRLDDKKAMDRLWNYLKKK